MTLFSNQRLLPPMFRLLSRDFSSCVSNNLLQFLSGQMGQQIIHILFVLK